MKSFVVLVIISNLWLVSSEISKVEDSNGTDFESFEGLARTLDIFNVEYLNQNWNVIKLNLSEECAIDVDGYLKGLVRKDRWALKSKLRRVVTMFGHVASRSTSFDAIVLNVFVNPRTALKTRARTPNMNATKQKLSIFVIIYVIRGC